MTDYLSYSDFIADVSIKYEKQNRLTPGKWRYGQMFFNMASNVRPDVAEALRGTLHDPFHKNVISPETHVFIEGLW